MVNLQSVQYKNQTYVVHCTVTNTLICQQYVHRECKCDHPFIKCFDAIDGMTKDIWHIKISAPAISKCFVHLWKRFWVSTNQLTKSNSGKKVG